MNKIFSLVELGFSKARKHTKRLCHKFSAANLNEREKNRTLLVAARNSLYPENPKNDPLVSVLIATYNRGNILTERTIPSILKQTHQNFEIVVVGDHCTDNTEKLLKDFNDNRIQFHNLSKRGDYPSNRFNRWLVAGATPRNKSIELSKGDWIATLDDDDEFTEDHIESLLKYALDQKKEMVYGKVLMEIHQGKWKELGAYPPRCGTISHLSALYSAMLKFIKYDINAWKYSEPADWNFWRRMKESGAKVGFINKVVGKHYLEESQLK